jgi:hypothetical protein
MAGSPRGAACSRFLEETDAQNRIIHVTVTWDEWSDLDAQTRSEMIVDALQGREGQAAVVELTLAMGLTHAELRVWLGRGMGSSQTPARSDFTLRTIPRTWTQTSGIDFALILEPGVQTRSGSPRRSSSSECKPEAPARRSSRKPESLRA